MYQEAWEKAADFHGHKCGGLALGVRAALEAAERFGIKRAEDEEVVCVTENDACCVDGIQSVLGCTIGKGNLVYRGTGKLAFSFFSRTTGKSFRFIAKDKTDGLRGEEYMKFVLTAPFTDVFAETAPRTGMPEEARRMPSVKCSVCGESAPETKIRIKDGKPVCLECFDDYDRGW